MALVVCLSCWMACVFLPSFFSSLPTFRSNSFSPLLLFRLHLLFPTLPHPLSHMTPSLPRRHRVTTYNLLTSSNTTNSTLLGRRRRHQPPPPLSRHHRRLAAKYVVETTGLNDDVVKDIRHTPQNPAHNRLALDGSLQSLRMCACVCVNVYLYACMSTCVCVSPCVCVFLLLTCLHQKPINITFCLPRFIHDSTHPSRHPGTCYNHKQMVI